MSAQANAEAFVGGSLGYSEYAELVPSDAAVFGNASPSNSSGSVISAQRSQNKGALGYRIFAGAWMTDLLGAEVGYAALGKTTEALTNMSVSPTLTWTGSVATTAIYGALDLHAGVHKFDEANWYAKLGAYSAWVHSDSSLSAAAGYSHLTESTTCIGPFFGIGYARKVSSNLSARMDVEVFYNVKVVFNQGNATFSSVTSVSLTSLSLMETF
jgi:hypothetical protein